MKFFIKEAREKAGLSQKELAELIGVAPNTMHGYESGKHDPKSDLLKKISAACHVSIDFLLGNSSRTDAIKPAWELSKEEMTHIKKYRTLDRYGKEAVDAVLDVECRRYAEYKAALAAKEEEEESHVIEMPSYLQSVSAGYGNWLEEAEEITITVPDTPMTRRADFAIRVSGDSMEPRYSDGDLVFVKKQEDVEVGEYGIWIVDGSAYIKKRGVDRLISLNRQYPDVEQGEDVFCVGKVIGKL